VTTLLKCASTLVGD